MTREETKRIMFIIANESKGFMPTDEEMQSIKVDTWFAMLKTYEFEIVQRATMMMLARFVYGTSPKIGDLFEILSPKKEKENIGQEFADRIIKLISSIGTENAGDKVLQEFGPVGFQIYQNNKESLRLLETDDISTVKAQLRNSYNSMNERHERGELTELPYQSNKIIMTRLEENGLKLNVHVEGEKNDNRN